MKQIRVLVVDDSIVVRRVVTEELEAEPDIDVVVLHPTAKCARKAGGSESGSRHP